MTATHRSGWASGTHRIVIVGGGAGGLALATRLGNRYGRRGLATVTLVDKARTHVWKPLLHEIAAGSMDPDLHELDFLAQAHWHHFSYRVGELIGLDRRRRQIELAPYHEDGELVTPQRSLEYDTLVLAIGSTSNDFGTPGVRENAISLDTAEEAERFHRRLVNACLRAQAQHEPLRPEQLRVAIVGAGATGVELAAELHHATRVLVMYGLDRIDPERDIRIDLVEAGNRILGPLPERVATDAKDLLVGLGVRIRTSSAVAEVRDKSLVLKTGEIVPAELVVWAAGVKAPDLLRDLDGLETNKLNQVMVEQTLASTRDPNVFAIGDCACCPWPGHEKQPCVPPRAQAANQQAAHLYRQMDNRLRGGELKPFRYRDFGSLVSLGEYTTVGNLMGKLVGGNLVVEGLFARLMYRALYQRHLFALHGFSKVALDTLSRLLTRRTEPRVKLH